MGLSKRSYELGTNSSLDIPTLIKDVKIEGFCLICNWIRINSKLLSLYKHVAEISLFTHTCLYTYLCFCIAIPLKQ